SLVVSLTLTPMMCSRLLNSGPRQNRTVFDSIVGYYGKSLSWSLRHPLIMIGVLALAVALNVYLYVAIPKGFFPQQDTGRLIGFIRADQTTSFQAMQKKPIRRP